MSAIPNLVTLVFLVHAGQGYAPVTLPRHKLTLTPGKPFEAHPRIAERLLADFPGTIAVVSFELPAEQAEPLPELGSATGILLEGIAVEVGQEGLLTSHEGEELPLDSTDLVQE